MLAAVLARRELERKACDTLSTRDQANAAACPKVVDLRPASIKKHHRASCVPAIARRVASLSRTGLPQYRALGVGATPCRLVSLIHTFGGPYGSSLGVNRACQMKVNRMSLALAAFGQEQPWSRNLQVSAGVFARKPILWYLRTLRLNLRGFSDV
jgi:hypothetical protein